MRRFMILLMLAASLAGCAGSDPERCEGAACLTPTTSPGPTEPAAIQRPPFPPLPYNETRRTAVVESCTGFIADIYVPYESVRAKVPPEFENQRSPETVATGDVTVAVLDCPKAVLGETILEQHKEFWLSAAVDPVNQSWEGGRHVSRWTMDVWSTSEQSVAFYRAMGFPTMLAEIGRMPRGQSIEVGSTWRVATASATLDFEIPPDTEPGATSNATNFFWVGDDVFFRSRASFTYQYQSGLKELVVTMTGSSNLSSLAGQDVALGGVQTFVTTSHILVVEPELYGGSKNGMVEQSW